MIGENLICNIDAEKNLVIVSNFSSSIIKRSSTFILIKDLINPAKQLKTEDFKIEIL